MNQDVQTDTDYGRDDSKTSNLEEQLNSVKE